MPKKITISLSQSSIQNAIKELRQYQNDLNRKCEELAHRLADEGVIIAKMEIMSFPAVCTGELLESIRDKPGAVITNGSQWVIYTGCPWAKYVEFGTGLVGQNNPHPEPGLANWKYDINNHGESGWFYFKDGEWHWTKGMPSRPFMYETRMELATKVAKIAREVFRS